MPQVQITSVTSPVQKQDLLSLQVTVRNTADHAITILKWDNPLDPQAGMLDIFELRDQDDGTILQAMTVMLNRLLPPSRDSLVEIAGKGEAENSAEIRVLQWISGRTYEVQAKGRWKGVWDLPASGVTLDMLDHLERASGGNFESNTVTFMVE
ncbi:hypothetical protein MMC24_001877 [Lignoscripta atroalba]|nr:hypothetical protein [Lignoscripta atroalba]